MTREEARKKCSGAIADAIADALGQFNVDTSGHSIAAVQVSIGYAPSAPEPGDGDRIGMTLSVEVELVDCCDRETGSPAFAH